MTSIAVFTNVSQSIPFSVTSTNIPASSVNNFLSQLYFALYSRHIYL